MSLFMRDIRRKGKLELHVTQVVQDFLSDRKIVEKASQDTINYHEQRTGDNEMKSIEAQIRHTQDEAENNLQMPLYWRVTTYYERI